MRLIVNSLVAMMLLAILGGAVLSSRHGWTRNRAREAARIELHRFQQQVGIQSALEQTTLNDRGYPMGIEPAWFGGDLPDNVLLDPGHPWLEIAPPEHQHLPHPPVWTTDDPSFAQYWYNPERGVVRARVPHEASEATALDLYNYVNETALATPPLQTSRPSVLIAP